MEDRGGLRARPLERLLDLGAGGVRQLGRLVARLLEHPVSARLRFTELLRCLAVRVCEQFPDLVPRAVQQLRTLTLALLAVALDLCLALLDPAAAAADLLLRLLELRLRRLLRVTLDGVCELGRGADQMQRVHPYRVARRLDLLPASARRSLQNAKLRLELCVVPAERLERLRHAIRVVPALGRPG